MKTNKKTKFSSAWDLDSEKLFHFVYCNLAYHFWDLKFGDDLDNVKRLTNDHKNLKFERVEQTQ